MRDRNRAHRNPRKPNFLITIAAASVALFTGIASAQVAGTYHFYGRGCAGTGVKPSGTVLPPGYETKYAGSSDAYPFGTVNMHYMQVHDGADLPMTALVRGLNLRKQRYLAQPAFMLTMDIYVGYTANPPTSLNPTFAANWTGTPVRVFRGTLNVPAVGAISDPTIWTMKIPFTIPFVYSRPRGNFLFECVNTTMTRPTSQGFDAKGVLEPRVSRLYARTSTATTGTFDMNFGLVVQLETPSTIGAIVDLTTSGVPEIGKTHRINVTGAVANSAAVLWLGTRQLGMSLGSALPGCTLYTSLDIILGAVSTGATGSGSLPVKIPSNRGLIGVQYYNQWMVVDSAANTLGVVFSRGGAAKIGG